MKIRILLPAVSGGGAEHVARSWCRHLQIAGHDVALWALDPRNGDQGDGFAPGNRFPFDRAGRGRWLRVQRWVREAVAEERPDVLLASLTIANLAAVTTPFIGVPRRPAIVICEHNVPSRLLPLEGTSGRIQLGLARALYRRADAAIGVSHAIAADLASSFYVAERNLWVVPIGATSRRLASDVEADLPGTIRLGFAGRLVPQKRPELTIETASELRNRGLNVEVVFAGDGPLRSMVSELARRARVPTTLLGWTDDWRAAIGTVDCLILPSVVEGFGLVLVEAAEHGVPVVGPAQALGLADAIVPGVTGALALSARPRHLADGVVRALKRQAASDPTSLAGWFDWFGEEHSAEVLSEILRTVVAERLLPSGIGQPWSPLSARWRRNRRARR